MVFTTECAQNDNFPLVLIELVQNEAYIAQYYYRNKDMHYCRSLILLTAKRQGNLKFCC